MAGNPIKAAWQALVRGTIILALLSAGVAAADDWPNFRGPGARATSNDRGLPVSWSDDQNIVWKAELPGFGASSPIVVGERIFLTCYSGYGLDAAEPGEKTNLVRHLLALDRSIERLPTNHPRATMSSRWQQFQPAGSTHISTNRGCHESSRFLSPPSSGHCSCTGGNGLDAGGAMRLGGPA